MLTLTRNPQVLGAQADYWRGMMGDASFTGQWYWQIHLILGTVTWILIIVLLLVAIRYFWLKGGKK